MTKFNAAVFTLHRGQYIAEMSTLQLRTPPPSFAVEAGGQTIAFTMTNSEQHCGEVTGWKYRQSNGSHTALLIND